MKYDTGVSMTTQEQTEITAFAEAEKQRIEAEKADRMAAQGYREFLKIPEGETAVEFKNEEPRPNSLYPDRVVFYVRSIAEDKEYDLSISKNSPLYRDIIAHLAQGHMNLKIVRFGMTKQDTRYRVTQI